MGEEIVFSTTSKMVQNDACGLPGWLLKAKTTKDPDVFRVIEKNIDGYGSIENLITEFGFALTKSFVSPLSLEREMDIHIQVKNCLGEPVFDRHHGQVVLLPRETKRGELKPTLGFPQDAMVTENSVILEITHEAGGSTTSTLKRGLEPDFDSFRAETCRIDTTLVKDLLPPVPIAGVFIEIEPEKPEVYPGEVTTVTAQLFQETPLRERFPMKDEPVTIEAKGLIDGSLEPKGSMRTDAEGQVFCVYRAGRKEDRITVSARYRPERYPDEVSAEAGISVMDEPQCFQGTVAFFVEFDYKESRQSRSGGEKRTSRTPRWRFRPVSRENPLPDPGNWKKFSPKASRVRTIFPFSHSAKPRPPIAGKRERKERFSYDQETQSVPRPRSTQPSRMRTSKSMQTYTLIGTPIPTSVP